MKTEQVESYPSVSMSVLYDAGLGEVYQLLFSTPSGTYTRLDRMWRQLDAADTSFDSTLQAYDILAEDWKAVRDLFDQAQFDNKVMDIDELKEYWAEYVNSKGELV